MHAVFHAPSPYPWSNFPTPPAIPIPIPVPIYPIPRLLTNMDYGPPSPGVASFETHLVQGCCREADRANIVALRLDGLRNALNETFHVYMTALSGEIRASSRYLRDISDRSQVHLARVSTVANHLNIVLPCLCRSLRDIVGYCDDKALTKEIRWRKMYKKMTDEAGGLRLPDRFILYNQYLSLLLQLLSGSPTADFTTLEMLRGRIMQLREQRGIAAPSLQMTSARQDDQVVQFKGGQNVHWAEKVFLQDLPSRTPLDSKDTKSKSYGPYHQWGKSEISPDSRIWARHSFNHDNMSVMLLNNSYQSSAYILIRDNHKGSPYFALKGVHELCIGREENALQLKRWSQSAQQGKPWALLQFHTWEEMVLFWCTFVSLKNRTSLTLEVAPDEYRIRKEKRLFQAQIIDDDFKHSLIVYEDEETRGVRLHASVWDGELKQCPVWTAFVTHQSSSPTWLTRKGKHRILLKDAQLFVFCTRYKQERMRQNKTGAFELNFVSEEGAQRFQEVFLHRDSRDSSETNDAVVAGPSS